MPSKYYKLANNGCMQVIEWMINDIFHWMLLRDATALKLVFYLLNCVYLLALKVCGIVVLIVSCQPMCVG